jgi:hypothetical protein
MATNLANQAANIQGLPMTVFQVDLGVRLNRQALMDAAEVRPQCCRGVEWRRRGKNDPSNSSLITECRLISKSYRLVAMR